MNQVAKKKTVTQKTRNPKAGAFKMPQANQTRKTTTITRPSVPVKATNGVTVSGEDAKGLAEYLIYKQLKAEVSEFYPYPGLWLESPHDLLGGQTPLQMAVSGSVGKEVVLNLIQMIKAGMFT